MMLRRGASVLTTDGPFGTLADVVLDPTTDQLTHLVIAPYGELQQSRVVPLWLTNETDEGIRIELANRHVKELQRVLPGDYVRSDPSTRQTEHELRFRSLLRHPYFSDPLNQPTGAGDEGQIPIESFDVKCGLDVVSTNDRLLGKIVGFLVADEHVHAIVVRSGLVGFTHDVVVPIRAIAESFSDMVLLDLDRHEFRELGTTTVVSVDHTRDSLADSAKNAVGRAFFSTRERVKSTFFD